MFNTLASCQQHRFCFFQCVLNPTSVLVRSFCAIALLIRFWATNKTMEIWDITFAWFLILLIRKTCSTGPLKYCSKIRINVFPLHMQNPLCLIPLVPPTTRIRIHSFMQRTVYYYFYRINATVRHCAGVSGAEKPIVQFWPAYRQWCTINRTLY